MGFGFRVSGFGFWVSGFGFRIDPHEQGVPCFSKAAHSDGMREYGTYKTVKARFAGFALQFARAFTPLTAFLADLRGEPAPYSRFTGRQSC